MPNRGRNRSDFEGNERGRTPSTQGSSPDEYPRNQNYFGRERNQTSRYDIGRDHDDRPDRDEWNREEQFTGGDRFDEGRNQPGGSGRQDFSNRDFGRDELPRGRSSYRDDYGEEDRSRPEGNMFASSSGAPYGSQPDQRPFGSYGNDFEQDDDYGRSQNRGSRRFQSSTDLSSSYQGHYGQPRFGSVGQGSGFGTGSVRGGRDMPPRSEQTTSERNLYDSSLESDSGFTRPSFRGIGPKGFQRSDERIREMVSETLEDHDAIDARDIEVHVDSGEVTLTGTVSDRRTKRLAEDSIEFLPGVRDVTNNIKVKRGMFGRVADTIQDALSGDHDDDAPRDSSPGTTGRGKTRNRR